MFYPSGEGGSNTFSWFQKTISLFINYNSNNSTSSKRIVVEFRKRFLVYGFVDICFF